MGTLKRGIRAYLVPTAFAFVGVLLASVGFGRLTELGTPIVLSGGVPLNFLARYLLLGFVLNVLGLALVLHAVALVVRQELDAARYSNN